MRKIVYSVILKIVALILFISNIVCGVLIVTDGIVRYFNEDKDIYAFESDFSKSWFISDLLDSPEGAVFDAYHSSFDKQDNDNDIVVDSEEIEKNIKQSLNDFYYSDKVNYFVLWNDVVITNCGAKNAEELMQGEYFSYFKRDREGKIERSTTNEARRAYLLEDIAQYDKTSTIIISCNVKQNVADEYKAIWETQESILIDTFSKVLVCVVAALLLLIYLICVCGKNKDGEYKNMWIDNVWLEVHLVAIIGGVIGTVAVCIYSFEEYMYGYLSDNLIYLVIETVSAFGSLVIITSLLSVIRNIKTRRLIETSIILHIVRWICKQTKAVFATLFRLLSKKTGVILISMLFVYTVIIGALGIGTAFSPIWLILGVLAFGSASFVIAYRAKDLDEVKKGVSEVRGGNLAYKIPELKCDDMRLLAANVNDIAKGLDESVSAKVKAERLKTELITNVSHDLKTPITSIISYTELLSKTEDLSEEARDYVSVIAKKSDRLKKLTQDLFDISKAQSGNDDAVFEKLDVSLLVNQALGEYDSEILSSGLPFCVEAPKELYIFADGRKMSRVVGNLINNILKYTMKNTRVFIIASEKDGDVRIEFKNISAYPLDFDADEITGRFVRGDESRTTEGNGLGLAIAKSYTEICNGRFEIVVDGDMFKAILKFKKYS